MRGTAAGEPVVSQANTVEFEAGYDSVFGCIWCQKTDDPIVWKCPDCGAKLCWPCKLSNIDCYDTGRYCPGCQKNLPDSDGNTPTDWKALGYEVEGSRGRWIWDDRINKLVPAEEYQEPTGDGRVMVLGEAHYDGLVMTDGTVCDSRKKFREYLKATGCAVAGDYTEQLSERKVQRDRERADAKERRETIGRSIYQVEKGYRPARRYEDEPL